MYSQKINQNHLRFDASQQLQHLSRREAIVKPVLDGFFGAAGPIFLGKNVDKDDVTKKKELNGISL